MPTKVKKHSHHQNASSCKCDHRANHETTQDALKAFLNHKKDKINKDLNKDATASSLNSNPVENSTKMTRNSRMSVLNGKTAFVNPKSEERILPKVATDRKPTGMDIQAVSNSLEKLKIDGEFSNNALYPLLRPSKNKGDSREINELLNYIEGNKTVDKAEKKAAKKARQKLKKAEERERIEIERRLKEEEEERVKEEKRRQEEERLRAERKNRKKNKNSFNSVEETIPAMVTIKRVPEGNGNSSPTVTITLKGTTPEAEKLLFTLVNGHNNKEQLTTVTINADKTNEPKGASAKSQNNNQSSRKNKKKSKINEANATSTSTSASKEFKVNISAADRQAEVQQVKPSEDINLSMLRLPPGITITKISDPSINKKIKSAAAATNLNTHSISKTNTIEIGTSNVNNNDGSNKKNKKKNKKKQNDQKTTETSSNQQPSTITLRNPMFHTLHTTLSDKGIVKNPDATTFSDSQQALIFKNDNGTVTIRSPKVQNFYENGPSVSTFLSGGVKPSFVSEASPPQPTPSLPSATSEISKLSLNAQEILSGLPEIEITKVNNKNVRNDPKNKKP